MSSHIVSAYSRQAPSPRANMVEGQASCRDTVLAKARVILNFLEWAVLIDKWAMPESKLELVTQFFQRTRHVDIAALTPVA